MVDQDFEKCNPKQRKCFAPRNFADRRYLNIGQATAAKCSARWNSSSVSSLAQPMIVCPPILDVTRVPVACEAAIQRCCCSLRRHLGRGFPDETIHEHRPALRPHMFIEGD